MGYILRYTLALCTFVQLSHLALAEMPDRPQASWLPNGPVYTSAHSFDGRRFFIGGSFDFIGPKTGSSVLLNDNDASLVNPVEVNGTTYVSIADGSGGGLLGAPLTPLEVSSALWWLISLPMEQ